ncbi:MAG: 23S rRNA (adenine(2503)-C(2))-methyltransferase RlmN [Fibrobacterota bacterium]|nr:23S rRNA (adenine(2503)-C(2))-methyltransferase RlmN [Fibrobacterota bacterium]QQS06739.1 MAG: 23S rRNA (adenine(2503)-C(2))-methyltransferase RlmN [Fibrobacterota bacterium]
MQTPTDARGRSKTLSELTSAELQNWLADQKQPKFRAAQIQEWLWTHFATSYDQMTNLPKDLRALLASQMKLGALDQVDQQVSSDGTAKWAFQDADGKRFETVMIPEEDRRTACVSSQVGCAMGCTFCRTAQMGFQRNLTHGEILQQVAHVRRYLRDTQQPQLTNIVFMGMGEPLNNLANVLHACEVITHPKGLGMSPRRITISTSGLIAGIDRLAEEAPQYHLAISLNSSNDEMRNRVMPVNRRHPIHDLLQAGDAWSIAANWPVTYEYVLIGDVTCTSQAARELVGLLGGRHCKINLIPLNAADDIALRAPTADEVLDFESRLIDAGLQVYLRKPKGQDILAACGQLAQKGN